LPTQNNTRC